MAIAGGMNKSILAALLLSLVLEHIQVEAIKTCCPSTDARNMYYICRARGEMSPTCAAVSGCLIISGGKCKPPYDHLTLHSDTEEVNVLRFCKLGCVSAVCNNMDAAPRNEEANKAVLSCDEACSRFCNDHVGTATVVA